MNNKLLLVLAGAMLLGRSVLAGGAHEGGHGHESGHAEGHGQAAMHAHEKGGHNDDHGRSAVGRPGDPAKVDRVIAVDLLDAMRLDFKSPFTVRPGETVKFVVSNRGAIRHEFSIGSAAEQAAHREMMRRMPGMVHEDGNSITVEPGQTRELVWTFDGQDEVVFSCNIPGHAEAGMTRTARLVR